MARTILFPFDGSDTAQRALPYAAALATLGEAAKVMLLTVLPTREGPDIANDPPLREEWERTAKQGLDGAASRLRELGVQDVQAETRWSMESEDEIVRASHDHGVSFIVLGTHGRGGLARALLGSTAMNVIRESSVPCLLVPPGAHVDRMQIRQALLAVDGSELSAQAIPVAKELASGGVKIHVLRVVPPSSTMVPFAVPGAEGYIPVSVLEDITAAAEEDVREVVSQFPNGAAEGMTLMGSPAHTILEQVEQTNADLVVMTTHARTALGRVFLGSVTDRVVRTSDVPVLVIRPQEHD